MAQKKSNSKNGISQKKLISIIAGAVVILLAALFGGTGFSGVLNEFGSGSGATGTYSIPSSIQITDPSAFSMHVIDIGQGDCILLSKDGKYALVDAGKSTQKTDGNSTAAILQYLEGLGVKKLEFMLITHQDYDHIGSAKTILSKYPTSVFYDNGYVHTSATYEKLMTYLDNSNIKYKVVSAGDTIASPWSGVTISVLSPPAGLLNDDANDNSIVLKITYGNVSYLLAGDATKNTEKYILSTGVNLDSDVLKVGHHGSYASSTTAFLKAVGPTISVISVGELNEYGHPHKDALKRIIKFTKYLYRTDVDGTVIVSSDGKTYSVKTENNLPYNAATEFTTGDGFVVKA